MVDPWEPAGSLDSAGSVGGTVELLSRSHGCLACPSLPAFTRLYPPLPDLLSDAAVQPANATSEEDRGQSSEAAAVLDYADPATPVEEDDRKNLKRRTVSGSAWTMGGYVVTNVLRFVTNLILVRLVLQSDFGTAAALASILQGLQMFSDVGIGPLVVQNPKGVTEPFLRTAFTLQFFRGIVLMAIACALAWPLAWFYDIRELLWLIPITTLSAFFEGCRSTAFYRLHRRLRFKELTILEVGRMVLTCGGMLTWAYFSPSVYALIVPPVLAIAIEALVSHFLLPDRRDKFGWSSEAATEALNFGGWIFLSTALLFLAGSSDKLVFFKLYTPEDVAVYQIAFMLATLPTMALLKVGVRVVFPAYANVAQDINLDDGRVNPDVAARFQKVFTRVRTMLLLGGGFAVTGLIASGPAMVQALYPDSYGAAAWMLQLLAAGAWLQIMAVGNDSAMLALGKPKWIAASNGAKVLAMAIGIPLLHLQYGIAGSIGAIAGAEVARYFVSAIAAKRLPVSLHMIRRDAFLTLIVAATCFLAWEAGHLVQPYGDLARFAVAAVATCVLWAPLGWWWKTRMSVPKVQP